MDGTGDEWESVPSLLSCFDMFNQQTVAGDTSQIKRASQMSVTPATLTKTRLPCVSQCADPEIISQSRTTTAQTPRPPTPNSAPAFCLGTPSAMGASSAVHYWWGLSWMWLCSSSDGHRAPASSHGEEGGEGRKEAGCLALVPSCGGRFIHHINRWRINH